MYFQSPILDDTHTIPKSGRISDGELENSSIVPLPTNSSQKVNIIGWISTTQVI